MILNNRQTAILYELTEKDGFITYDYLCSKFFATEKTIRTDIKKLNQFFQKEDISVELVKGKGFHLLCPESKRKNLDINFNYRYRNASEVIETYNTRDLHLYYLLSKGYVKIEHIAKALNTNTKSISVELKTIRENLKEYELELVSKPYYGVKIEGRENNIRSAFVDSACFMVSMSIEKLFYDDPKAFEIDPLELQQITDIFLKVSSKYHIPIAQISLIKLVVAVVISYKRLKNGYQVEMDKESIELNGHFYYKNAYDEAIDLIEEMYQTELPTEEREYLISYAMVLSDFSDSNLIKVMPEKVKEEATVVHKLILRKLIEENICDYRICSKSETEYFSERIRALAYEIVLRKAFHIIEMDVSNTLKGIATETPLCNCISSIILDDIYEYCGFRLGRYFSIKLTIEIYSCIRYINRLNTICRIALFSPFHKSLADTTIERIMYHCHEFIEGIDVLNTYDIANTDLSKYDLLLCFDNYEPIGLKTEIERIRISFYVTRKDLDVLYSKLSVMSRSYRNSFASFGTLKKSEILDQNVKITSNEDTDDYILKMCEGDEKLIRQAERIRNSELYIQENTLAVVLFTDRDDLKKTRLVKLDKPLVYNKQKYDCLLVSINKSDNSIATMKTAESLVRTIISSISQYGLSDESEIEDFYEYYIQGRRH